MNNDSLTYQDALRLNGPLQFNLIVKPAGSLCNLDCSYCYYLDKSEIYGGIEPRMSIEELEKFISTYIKVCESDVVTFNWHGGEPLVLGLDFYRKAVAFERKYCAKYGKKAANTLQTNATLVTDEWAGFLRDNGFLVGVSIDGPQEVHDSFRRDKSGAPTWKRVVRGIETLYKADAEYNLMCTVNKASEGRGKEIYATLKQLGSRFIQFMPVVEHVVYPLAPHPKNVRGGAQKRPRIVSPLTENAVIAPWSVSGEGYGRFLCDVFDEWISRDVGEYFINIFEATLCAMSGNPVGTCSFAQTCGGNAVVEHNGDIYCCDHFVYPEWKIGNLYTDNLHEMMTSPVQVKFGTDKLNRLPRKCLKCKYLRICNGECPKHRFSKTGTGETGLNALCEGLYKYFDYTVPRMEELLKQL